MNTTFTRRLKNARSNVFKAMLCREDFLAKVEKLEQAKPSSRVSLMAEICKMFDTMGIACEQDRENAYYRNLAETANLPEFRDVESSIIHAMYESFEAYPTPTQYMLRIVDRLSDPRDPWENDTLRLRILKQFIKYGNCLCYETDCLDEAGNHVLDARGNPRRQTVYIYNGKPYLKSYVRGILGRAVRSDEELLEHLDDGVFDVLETATRAQRRSNGRYGLLRMADDLASGKFKASGATKRELYLFAYVFNMTFVLAAEGETGMTINYNSDIEKNLFEDYYTNNLMRWLTSAYESNLAAYELDPSGQGINYKNFAEMVYLYFLVQPGTPIERLQQATEMIERLKANAAAGEIQEKPVRQDETMYFRNLYTEDVLAMPVDEFEAFIAEHYDCDVRRLETGQDGSPVVCIKGDFQISTSQQTAFALYQELLEAIEKSYANGVRSCNYGLWFTDVSMGERDAETYLADMTQGRDPEKTAKLAKLLRAINMFMGVVLREEDSDASEEQEHTAASRQIIKALKISSPDDMTRTAMIVAYYYFYNIHHEERNTAKTFMEVYEDYTDPDLGLNSYLMEAHYQPINERSIFDIAVIFSSYAYFRH